MKNKKTLPEIESERYKELHQKAMEQEKKSFEILKDKNLLNRCIEEIQKKVVGERETILTILICANGRNVLNHNLASYNLLINDESGLGKDFITYSVCELLPEHQFVYRTKITPETLTYWHNPVFEPEWTWDNKIFYLEDAPSKIINSEVFKIMASKGSKATVIINQIPRDIEIRGKPVIFVTSATVNPNEENLRRFPIVNLDESEEQTRKIMKRKGLKAKTGENIDYDYDLKEAISILTPVNVIIPFADKLSDFFPINRFMRTHFERFLDYIKSSASFHQKQREKNEDGYIIATKEDYEIARIMLLKTTSNPSMIPLTKDQQKILNFFTKNPNKWYAVNDIEDRFSLSDKWLRDQLDRLFKNGLLEKSKEYREGSKKQVMLFCFDKEKNSVTIPKWDEISTIDNIDTIHTIDTINTINQSTEENNKKPCESVTRTIESIESIVLKNHDKKEAFRPKNEKIKNIEKQLKKK